MLRHERHLAIIAQLEKKETLALEDLVGVIGASESTLRRDIDYLSDMKQVRKIRGGITRAAREPEASRLTTSPFSSEQLKHAARKAAIGKAAASLLAGDESIIINGGTTTWHMAEHLPKNGLTILTNSLPVIDYVSKQTSNRCFANGGEVFHHHMIILGHLRSEGPGFFGDLFFTGCQGISPWGIMEGDPLLVHAEQEFIRQSEKLIILADSSKFTTRKSIIMCPLDTVHTVVTDDGLDAESRKMLAEAGVELIIGGKSRPRQPSGKRRGKK
jgi:DeoR family ulaG and ulaABCDEF operon transcriptional repressor